MRLLLQKMQLISSGLQHPGRMESQIVRVFKSVLEIISSRSFCCSCSNRNPAMNRDRSVVFPQRASQVAAEGQPLMKDGFSAACSGKTPERTSAGRGITEKQE